ncbi:MAG TPA: cytosine permease [Vicinamibacterales bacterium]|nr:cytosine permease [Vicinamibacterales bacterium]
MLAVNSVELGAVPPEQRRQTPFDLFLIFAGANVVATTLQVGAGLAGRWSFGQATTVIVIGAVVGAALVAALAPIGTRLGVPSIVASRAALGFSGAQFLALLLFVTNFAWIAINNVIAASICARLYGGEQLMPVWAVGAGIVATVIVAGGPRLVGLADRFAVPALAVSGAVMTYACLGATWPAPDAAPASITARGFFGALDVTAGYQSTWLLMFADYSRYNRSGRSAAVAVFLGLALTAAWFMPLGFAAATIAGSDDPGAMVSAIGLGMWGALWVMMATLTTNFVNIYMSALALKSLRPSTPDAAGVWLIGGVGAALSVLSTAWLNQFADITLLLAGLMVPIGGILLAHYFLLAREVRVEDLYDRTSRYARTGGWSIAGVAAWAAGAVAFYVSSDIGGTLPALAVAIAVYSALARTRGD